MDIGDDADLPAAIGHEVFVPHSHWQVPGSFSAGDVFVPQPAPDALSMHSNPVSEAFALSSPSGPPVHNTGHAFPTQEVPHAFGLPSPCLSTVHHVASDAMSDISGMSFQDASHAFAPGPFQDAFALPFEGFGIPDESMPFQDVPACSQPAQYSGGPNASQPFAPEQVEAMPGLSGQAVHGLDDSHAFVPKPVSNASHAFAMPGLSGQAVHGLDDSHAFVPQPVSNASHAFAMPGLTGQAVHGVGDSHAFVPEPVSNASHAFAMPGLIGQAVHGLGDSHAFVPQPMSNAIDMCGPSGQAVQPARLGVQDFLEQSLPEAMSASPAQVHQYLEDSQLVDTKDMPATATPRQAEPTQSMPNTVVSVPVQKEKQEVFRTIVRPTNDDELPFKVAAIRLEGDHVLSANVLEDTVEWEWRRATNAIGLKSKKEFQYLRRNKDLHTRELIAAAIPQSQIMYKGEGSKTSPNVHCMGSSAFLLLISRPPTGNWHQLQSRKHFRL